MCKALITFLLIASASTSFADINSLCKDDSSLAMTIMSTRQKGTKITDLLAIFEDKKLSKEYSALGKLLVQWAYSRPRFDSPEYQKKAVSDFGTEVYLTCINAK